MVLDVGLLAVPSVLSNKVTSNSTCNASTSIKKYIKYNYNYFKDKILIYCVFV